MKYSLKCLEYLILRNHLTKFNRYYADSILWERRFRFAQIKYLGSEIALPRGKQTFIAEYILKYIILLKYSFS